MSDATLDLLRVLLVVMLALPAAAAALAALLGPSRPDAVRGLSLVAVLADLVLAVILVVGFVSLDRPAPGATFHPEIVPGADANRSDVTTLTLIPLGPAAGGGRAVRGIQFYVGLDGLNVWLVALTSVLMVSSVLVSWTAIGERVNEYYAWLLALHTGMLGVFLSFDIILFYVFFELTLVPLFFLIGIWGGPERRHAARKFFIYTLAGSLITLLGVLAVVLVCYHYPPPDPRLPAGQRAPQELTFSVPELVRGVNANLASPHIRRASWNHTNNAMWLLTRQHAVDNLVQRAISTIGNHKVLSSFRSFVCKLH